MNGVDHGSLTGRGQLRLRMLFQFSKNGAQTFRESVGIGGVGLRPSGRANIGSLNFGAFRVSHRRSAGLGRYFSLHAMAVLIRRARPWARPPDD